MQYGLGQTHIDEIRPRGLILLLDGLDEVGSEHRAACVKAINDYCAHAGWINLVITCRSDEYADLERCGHGLAIPWRQVVTLVPLETERIEKFLDQLDRVGIDVTNLHSLLENECTPLMTDVILQTHEGRPADCPQQVQAGDVWDNYVRRKFEDERTRREASGESPLYPPAMTRKWLKWVAQQLQTHTQDRHRLFVEELQPDWLPGRTRMLFYGTTFAVLFAAAWLITQFTFRAAVPVLYGPEVVRHYLGDYLRISTPLATLWLVSIVWVFARRSSSELGPVATGLLSGIVFGTMIWIPSRDMPMLALIGGGICGIIAVALVRNMIRILGFCDRQIVCVKRRKWDWYKAGSGLAIGIVFVLIIAAVSDVAMAMFFQDMGFWPASREALSLNTVVWWNWGLPGLLSIVPFLLFVLGLGWGRVVLLDEVDVPNEGIINSGKQGLVMAAGGAAAGLAYSLAIGVPCFLGAGFKASGGSCVSGDINSLLSGLGFGMGCGAILGYVFGLILGGFAWIEHYLLRWMLYLDRQQIPMRLGRFLDYATGIRLLRRVGGGFEFVDQELQAYFANTDADVRQDPDQRPVPGDMVDPGIGTVKRPGIKS